MKQKKPKKQKQGQQKVQQNGCVNIVRLQESLLWNVLNNNDVMYQYHSQQEELEGIVEAIIESLKEEDGVNHTQNQEQHVADDELKRYADYLMESLQDYLPHLELEVTTSIVKRVLKYANGESRDFANDYTLHEEEDDDNDNDNDNDDISIHSVASTHSDDDEHYIQDGECELCEREVKLTRHHLIPRSTWPRIKPRLLQAAPYFQEGKMQKVINLLHMTNIPSTLTMHHLSSGPNIKMFLSCYTCNLCKLCHKAVHKTFDNFELAERRNDVELLLEDETIRKFCKWANKQKPSKQW